jgi:hypothetical protein
MWGVVQFAVLSLVPTLTFWLLLHAGAATRFVRRLALRMRAVVRPPLQPAGLPIELIAADLRRLHGGMQALRPHASLAQREGALLAYDDALTAACRALGVEERLTAMPLGRARDAERLRIECELQYEGLVIIPAPAP